MARNPSFDTIEFDKAANSLIENGVELTARNLYEKLENKGSFSTIIQALKCRDERRNAGFSQNFDIDDEIKRAIMNVYSRILGRDTTQYEQENAALRTAIDELILKLEGCAEVIDASNARIVELESESSMKDGVIAELRASLCAVREVEQQLAVRVESLSYDLARKDVQLESLSNLEVELSTAKQSLELERERRHSAEFRFVKAETSRVAAEKLEKPRSKLTNC